MFTYINGGKYLIDFIYRKRDGNHTGKRAIRLIDSFGNYYYPFAVDARYLRNEYACLQVRIIAQLDEIILVSSGYCFWNYAGSVNVITPGIYYPIFSQIREIDLMTLYMWGKRLNINSAFDDMVLCLCCHSQQSCFDHPQCAV